MRPFHRFATKLLLAAIAVSAVPLVVLGVYAYARISRSLERSSTQGALDRVSSAASAMRLVLSGAESDVLFLSRLDSLRRLLEESADGASAQRWRRALEQDFLNFARAKAIYYQIRYIDETGKEAVRVDSDGRLARVVPKEELQDKRHRYYFDVTMRLGTGEVYVSPLDLNREQGRIEVPYKPTVRYGTPVSDRQGRGRGIVITNVSGDRLFQQAQDTLGGHGTASFIADERGFYLYHTSPQKAWSAPENLDTLHNLYLDFPDATKLTLSETPQATSGPWWSPGKVVLVLAVVRPSRGGGHKYLIVGQSHHRASILRPVASFRLVFVILLAVTVTVATTLAAVLARRLTRPVRSLEEGTRRVGAGDLQYRIHLESRDEFGALAQSFNTMSARLQEYMRDLEETTAAKARTEGELRAAHDIQQMFLPHQFPPFPQLPGIDIYARNLPARQVGGDFYDFFLVGDGVVALSLGDVSGKGVPAALLMTVTSMLLRTFALEGSRPSEALGRTNRALLERGHPGMFVTALVGLYQAHTHRLLFANAGHHAPLLVNSQGEVTALEGGDLPLGVSEDFRPEELSVELEPGQKVLLYSDGVTDAQDVGGRLFGLERLEELLRSSAALSARGLCEQISRAVAEHQAGGTQFDDVTVLVLEVR